jgi:hypothetical protein
MPPPSPPPRPSQRSASKSALPEIKPGQRWLSETQAELGLGIVDPHLHLNRPQQKLLAGAWTGHLVPAAPAHLAAAGRLAGPRTCAAGRRAHQPDPASALHRLRGRRRWAPRVLLADEVGLGKTIEAGLILHRMLLAGRARRVLVLVPEPLLHQWLVELLRRFNLRFSLFDRERIADAAARLATATRSRASSACCAAWTCSPRRPRTPPPCSARTGTC